MKTLRNLLLPGNRKPKPYPTVKRYGYDSLFDLACAEIGKTRSLDCLKRMCENGEDVEPLLDAIATTLVARLASPLPAVHLCALKLLFDVLTLFDLATRDGKDGTDCFSDDWFLMDEYQRHFIRSLYHAGVASVVPSLVGTSVKSGIFNDKTTFLNCLSRICQVLGDPFERALVEADCALPLMKAASPNSSIHSEVYRLQAFYMVETVLGGESGKQFADQVEASVPFLSDMFFLWRSDESERICDVSFSCSCLLLNHLGEQWARSLMSLPDSMPMLLRAATDERPDVRRFALGMMERMLSLLGPFFASKLDEAGTFDSLLGVYLSGDTRSSEVELRIANVLHASESDPAVLQKLASKMSTTPIINRLVSAHSPCAVSILNSVVMGDQSGDLARQLIVEGAISRCVDALTWKERWVSGGGYVEMWPGGRHVEFPPKLVREGQTQLGVRADALLHTLFAFDEDQKVKAFLHFIQRDSISVSAFNPNEHLTYSSIKAGFTAYRKGCLKELEEAFLPPHSLQQPHYPTLTDVANLMGLKGSPEEVLTCLSQHLEQHRLRLQQKAPMESSSDQQAHDRHLERLKNYVRALAKPKTIPRAHLAQFRQLLPPPPAAQLMPPAAPAMLPPPAAAPSAPLALMTPATPKATDAQIFDYLRQHILPRSDCDKCGVARGPDASVRLNFGTEAKNQCPSLKRACPLAAHAFSLAGDGVPLLDRFESDNNVTVGDGGSSGRTIKRQKLQDFMRSEHGVEPLGKPPHYKVTLYNAPQPGGGYTPASEPGTKGNYMGFKIV